MVLPLIFSSSVTIYEKEVVNQHEAVQHATELNFDAIRTLPQEAQRIIFCESSNNPNAINENIEDGEVWSTDWGYWQINDYYHDTKAREMGLDIREPYDNLKYGYWLYQTEGSKHWSASQKCWSNPQLEI